VSKIKKALLLLLIIAGVTLVILNRDILDAKQLEQWVQGAGIAGPIVFILIYATGTVLFFPGTILTFAGGALFGPVLGSVYNLIGATIGALIAFLVARYLASDWAEQKAGGKIKQLKHGIEDEGWKFVAFLRLVPLFPFNVLNYALGITRIGALPYTLASFIFMIPGCIAYTYIGYAGKEAATGSEDAIQKGLLALSLLAIVSFLPSLIKRLRKKS